MGSTILNVCCRTFPAPGAAITPELLTKISCRGICDLSCFTSPMPVKAKDFRVCVVLVATVAI